MDDCFGFFFHALINRLPVMRHLSLDCSCKFGSSSIYAWQIGMNEILMTWYNFTQLLVIIKYPRENTSAMLKNNRNFPIVFKRILILHAASFWDFDSEIHFKVDLSTDIFPILLVRNYLSCH